MTPEDFKGRDPEELKTIGFCPYCNMPGWIPGDDEWCEHYAGSSDLFLCSEPMDLLANGQEFERFRGLLERISELEEDELASMVASLPQSLRTFMSSCGENCRHLFWSDEIQSRQISVEVDEFTFTTEYTAFFLEDVNRERHRILALAEATMAALAISESHQHLVLPDGGE